MIHCSNLSKSFGKREILSNLSFSVEHGEICGLIGLNGVGKTTLLRLITGVLQPTTGTVSVLNSTSDRTGSFYREIGVVLDSDGFNGNLTFYQNMKFFGAAKQLPLSSIDTAITKHWQHLAKKNVPVKQFSRGERMQCALARAFLGSPKLILLDEPAANLDMNGYKLLCTLVKHAHEGGATVIISSHRLDAIEELCSTALLLSDIGIEKILLNDNSHQTWQLIGENIENAEQIIENSGGTVLSISSTSSTFKGVSKESTTQLIGKLIENDVEIHQLFLTNQTLSEMRQS